MAGNRGKEVRGKTVPKEKHVPSVRKAAPLAVLCGDIHLRHESPRARAEKGVRWYEAMASALERLWELQRELNVPIVCSGDVFHKWNAPAELINFAITHLPKMYSVRGNHDLPYHDYNLIKKSAYWTLVEAGVIEDIPKNEWRTIPSPTAEGLPLVLHGFPYGSKLLPNDRSMLPEAVHLAVVHAYVWTNTSTAYTGVSKDKYVTKYTEVLQNYDAALFGDNHVGFLFPVNEPEYKLQYLFNPGAFIRQSVTERQHWTGVGVVRSDGTIYKQRGVIGEEWEEIADRGQEETEIDLHRVSEFIELLADANTKSLDFTQILLRSLDGVNKAVKRAILECLEEKS